MNGQKPNILPVWAEPIVRFRAGDDLSLIHISEPTRPY